MNKLRYRKVFSQHLNTLAAVAEIASSQGKTAGRGASIRRRLLAGGALAGTVLGFGATQAWAQTVPCAQAGTIWTCSGYSSASPYTGIQTLTTATGDIAVDSTAFINGSAAATALNVRNSGSGSILINQTDGALNGFGPSGPPTT